MKLKEPIATLKPSEQKMEDKPYSLSNNHSHNNL
jgi:hypothetical protein